MPTHRTQNDPAGRANAAPTKRDQPSPGGVEGTGVNRNAEETRKRAPDAGSGEQDRTTAPASGGGMAGTGAPTQSRSHSGTSTTPGAGPNPGGPSAAGPGGR